ncbi:uncharacterized protein LOC126400971 [Epinephelus moara]|uniref:uncharacterized protein LOC126400971 n=1 Tax=Epinephelus moara TaxID=300413 RepID=UPI00214E2921|nr:uncharacterized protein LOC126400971 [Epinephelus moara]
MFMGLILSLLFQRDGLTLQMVSDGLQKTTLALVAMQTVPGQHLKQFLDEVGPFPGNTFSGVKLNRKQVDDDDFHKVKDKLINGFCDNLTTWFGNLDEGVLNQSINHVYLEIPISQITVCLTGLYSIQHPSVLRTLTADKEKLPKKTPLTGGEKKTVETSGRATEQGSLFQDGQTCNRCRTEQMKATATMFDVSSWPEDITGLATFGLADVETFVTHFQKTDGLQGALWNTVFTNSQSK